VNRYAATPLIVSLSPGHSDIIRFRPWSLIARGSHLNRAEEISKFLRQLAPLTSLIRVQAFRDPLGGELPHVQIFMNDGLFPLTWEVQLLSYWFSRNPAVFQDSLLRHRELGRAKDLSAPPRNTNVMLIIRSCNSVFI
jgi:hypothetical protein